MHPVAHIILQKLLRREDVLLPGVGTLRIVRSGAAPDGKGLLAAPRFDVAFEGEESAADPLTDAISAWYGSQDQTDPEIIYDQWLDGALTEDNTLVVENVAEIDLTMGFVVLTAEAEAMLNPAAGNFAVTGSAPQTAPKRLRPQKKNVPTAVTVTIIAGGVLAFFYVFYYLWRHTDIFGDLPGFLQ